MIDEIDTGIHYSRMSLFLQTVLQAASEYGVQLFMTTHNLECLQKFKNVLEIPNFISYQQETRMIKLRENKSEQIKATTFSYDAFAADIENENEVRGGASW